jgi:beta-N-acetylhexosaminidase
VLRNLSLDQKVGQLFLLGFSGTNSNNAAQIISDLQPGGIVFIDNADSAAAARQLTTALQETAHANGVLPLLFAIDQEGGRVQRLRTDFSQFPANWVIGHLGEADALAEVCQEGTTQGRELAAVGIQMNLAPVLDVLQNSANTVIGDRSYSADPATVARLGTAYIQALQATGMSAVGKHFPGHGSTAEDSHLTLPSIAYDRARLDANDLVPFRAAIAGGVRAIMTAHIYYPRLDPVANRPASLSPVITTDLLRRELGFQGLVLTDDLGAMQAITANFTPEQAAVAAVAAGADLLTVSGPGDAQRRMLAAVRGAIGSTISETQLDDAVEHVLITKQRAGLLGSAALRAAAPACPAV